MICAVPDLKMRRIQTLSILGGTPCLSMEFPPIIDEIRTQQVLKSDSVCLVCLSACTSGSASQIIVDDRGGLESPGYPYDVPEHLSCRWLFTAADDQVYW